MKKQIGSILRKRLEDICVEVLGELPSMELFPGKPKVPMSVSCITRKDKPAVKKKWDKFLKTISTKRRMVRLEEFEEFDLIGGEPYPKRLDIRGFVTVGDPLFFKRAVLDIPKDMALKIIVLGFVPLPDASN